MTQLPNRLLPVSFIFCRAHSAPTILLTDYRDETPKKEGEIVDQLLCAYRFLSISTSTSPTATIAMITPIMPGMK
jgi:hypothetical protein